MRHKDLWFAEYERLYNEAADRYGHVPDSVNDHITHLAIRNVNERLADAADMARKKERGE